ncbi:MAG: tautomerase family protein [Rhodovibrionaceae bacterium]|nr:tautomerase family protein [Rhodovibrionaceae bacterium]
MPIVRADIPIGSSDEHKARLRMAIKDAIIAALAPKETKYIYVAIRDVFAEVGDGAPTVTVDLRPGREVERKKALADAIAGAFQDAGGISREHIYLLFRENPAENHYCGGSPLAPWVPADK